MARIDSGGCSVSADWLHYADPPLAPLRRSRTGSITPIIGWLQYADHEVAPLRRSVTTVKNQFSSGRVTSAVVGVPSKPPLGGFAERPHWRPANQ